ncbi:MAG TPA: hypothetical protein VND21_03905 [Planctomycetota bacterium]|nr:hypothetical protein [Planctomycetota bacterium]
MNPPPGALRWTTLLATAVVVLGGASGYFLWHRIATDQAALPAAASGRPDGARGPRRLDPPAGMDPSEAERLRDLVTTCLDAESRDDRLTARTALERVGEPAVPFLLDAAARLATEGEGFAVQATLRRLHRLDVPLSTIRRGLTSHDPAPPWRAQADAAWAKSRVEQWFAWWDARP